MGKENKIFVAGGSGFVGKRMILRLKSDGYNYCTTSLSMGHDFRDPKVAHAYFEQERPDIVINLMSYVGGIKFNAEHEGEIFHNNTLLNLNLQDCAREWKVKKFINPIANCSYPDVTDKDFKESEWWDGPLHPSVMVYGFVKKMTWVNSVAYSKQYDVSYVNFLVPNMYGPDDHFEEVRSHAMGALIMKIIEAKEKNIAEVIVWGTGKPVREWLYVDDFVEGVIRAIDIDAGIRPINIGQGVGMSIAEIAEKIKKMVGYGGKLTFDSTRADGAAYKVMNVDYLKEMFGWIPETSLDNGMKKTIEWYYQHVIKKS